jgi:hypothetical protein
MNGIDVDRMRRYRERTNGKFAACARCRAIFTAMEATEDYSVARLTLGAEHFGHVMRDHWPSAREAAGDRDPNV